MRHAIGLDVGGTKVAGAIVSENGGIRGYCHRLLHGKGASALEDILAVAAELRDAAKKTGCSLCGIGIAVPGAVDLLKGTVQKAPNLAWRNLPLRRRSENRLGLVTEIDLDVRAAALGEMLYGAARGLTDFIYVTVGTGIGSGIVINSKLLYGHHSTSGEIGHAILEKNGARCGCGMRGCFEALAAGPAIAARAKRALDASDGRSLLAGLAAKRGGTDAGIVFDAARRGDALALRVVDETVDYLGRGLAILVNVVDPQCIIVGGGVGRVGAFLLRRVRASVASYTLHESAKNVKILRASNPGKIEVLGAAALVFTRRKLTPRRPLF